MSFLLAPLGWIGLMKSDEEDNGMSTTSIASLLSCAMCLGMMGYGISKSPVKTPPMMIAMLVCCCCSSSSSGIAVKDIMKKLGI
jgi:hypothetical protein